MAACNICVLYLNPFWKGGLLLTCLPSLWSDKKCYFIITSTIFFFRLFSWRIVKIVYIWKWTKPFLAYSTGLTKGITKKATCIQGLKAARPCEAAQPKLILASSTIVYEQSRTVKIIFLIKNVGVIKKFTIKYLILMKKILTNI